ncbi:type VI secretion system baseplate subunit TssF [Pseudomonas sp. TH04]|uniref:type VI secretion system baseplate subunit TssF n=1 Tax=Pseudomonas sp. TH04 TaxID=2796370 RepID=UPI001914800F|nr:type VI secretion system baseplate subunit TssF [Pseudomonas sp. TH04]
MQNLYYQSELNNLRHLADEFAQRNPALAPLLGSGSASDPDVERLLEGVAFLTGMVRQRLDDEFPEFVQELAQLLYPQYLQPLPCMTLLQFAPRTALSQTQPIATGCEVASVPIDGHRASFRSTMPVDLEPVTLTGARWDGGTAERRSLVLDLALTVAPDDFKADSLTFYLGDTFSEACALLRLLDQHVREIRIQGEGQPITLLSANHIQSCGFDRAHALLPYPDAAHPAYRGLQEYFALPEKFLFVRLSGLQRWRHRGEHTRMSVKLVFDNVPSWAPALTENSFMLGVTPAVNLFTQDAHPLRVDHRQAEYRIQPANQSQRQRLRIHSVLSVSAYSGTGNEKTLNPFHTIYQRDAFNLRIRQGSNDPRDYEHFISLPYVDRQSPQDVTLSISLLCTDGPLPESLHPGDLNQPMDNTPARVTLRNIRGITPCHPPKYQDRLLWRMLSQLNANHFKLLDADYLKSLLKLYLPSADEGGQDANNRRINGIEKVVATHERRFINGLPIEGTVVHLECRGDHFLGAGGLYLFGVVLDEFFAGSVAVNSFVALNLYDSVNQETLAWPAKIGRQRLL